MKKKTILVFLCCHGHKLNMWQAVWCHKNNAQHNSSDSGVNTNNVDNDDAAANNDDAKEYTSAYEQHFAAE